MNTLLQLLLDQREDLRFIPTELWEQMRGRSEDFLIPRNDCLSGTILDMIAVLFIIYQDIRETEVQLDAERLLGVET